MVTAERRTESIDKVPISIDALSQQTMDDFHIESVADLASIVPGLVISPTSTFQDNANIAIRGIFSSGANSPTTQLYIDDTPIAIRQLTNAQSKSFFPDIFDLDRVEVLRGPQGTLFGASAMGGAIRFITPSPNLTDASGFAKADISYADGGAPNYEVGAAYGAPVAAGTAGFRVSAWYKSLGGFIDQVDPFTGDTLEKNANRSNAYSIRPAFSWTPSDALTITTAAFLQHQYSQNSNSYWLTGLPAPEDASRQDWGGVAQPMTDDLRVFSLSVKYKFGGLSFVSDSSYLDRESSTTEDVTQLLDYILTGQAFIPSLSTFEQKNQDISVTHAWQQEFRVSSDDPSSRVNWVVGAFYRRAAQGLEQLETPDLTPIFAYCCGQTSLEATGVPDYIHNGEVLNSYTSFHATDTSEALFGNVTVSLLPRLKLDVGLRGEHLIVGNQAQFVAGPFNFLGVESTFVTLPDAVANPVTPRASLTYQFTDTDMVYVSAAKGYRPGGGNTAVINSDATCQTSLREQGIGTAPETFGPDSLWSYELGTKDRLFDQRLSIEASVYYIKWNKVQTQVNLPSCGLDFTANRGEEISQGFDLQLAAAVTHDLKVGAQVGYTHAYLPNAAYGAPTDGVPSLLNGAGDSVAGVLPWTAAANAQYSRDIGELWSEARSYLRVDYRWLGAATSTDPRVAGYNPLVGPYTDPSYGQLNLRLGVAHRGLDLSAYVNNVTRSNPRLGFTTDFPTGDQLYTANAIRPLTVGVTGWYRY